MKKHIQIHLLFVYFIGLFSILFSTSILSDSSLSKNHKLSAEGQAVLRKGEGAVTDATFFRIATQLSKSDFLAAFYGENRSHRRIALDAAGYLENPWPIIPYLVSFMEAAERQAASAASDSLRIALHHAFDLRASAQLPIAGQAKYMCELLGSVAQNVSLDADLRASAIQVAGLIKGGTGKECRQSLNLLSDKSLAVRQAALNSVRFPLKENVLALVVTLATDDDEATIRGTAVSMVCENALSHQILKPSSDLVELVAQLLDSHSDEQVVAPVLGCLARFPYRARASLTDKILNCGNEKIIKYWKSLTQ